MYRTPVLRTLTRLRQVAHSRASFATASDNTSSPSVDYLPAANSSPEHSTVDKPEYWRHIPRWQDVTTEQFLRHKWQMSNTVQSEKTLNEFLTAVLPEDIPPQTDMAVHLRINDVRTPEDFIRRLKEGIKHAPMAIRLSPHILSSINWKDPINDPIRRQFIPLSTPMNVDHPMAELDPMKENVYSPVEGLIHRYPDRALFFGQRNSFVLSSPEFLLPKHDYHVPGSFLSHLSLDLSYIYNIQN